jgi:uncharacterized protein YdeI (YjbR/CyaY-like superfamily)
MPATELETFYPKTREEWRKWLEQNHATAQSIWLVYYKKSTNIASISWSEAVDEALCFGWIDSTKKTIDHERYMQYFSRRKPISNWSKINKDKVAKLIQEERMTKAGFDSIATAKKNGSWTILDEVENLVIPADLKEALTQDTVALTYFDNLSKSQKKILLHWVFSAKRAETREKRIVAIVENASKKLIPTQFT